jgi:hypothetical protein
LFIFNVYPEDIEKYKHETINEVLDHQDEESTNLTDDQLKQLKRAKTVYKALKKGKATFNLASSFDEPDEHTIKYELGDPYYYWILPIPIDENIPDRPTLISTTNDEWKIMEINKGQYLVTLFDTLPMLETEEEVELLYKILTKENLTK